MSNTLVSVAITALFFGPFCHADAKIGAVLERMETLGYEENGPKDPDAQKIVRLILDDNLTKENAYQKLKVGGAEYIFAPGNVEDMIALTEKAPGDPKLLIGLLDVSAFDAELRHQSELRARQSRGAMYAELLSNEQNARAHYALIYPRKDNLDLATAANVTLRKSPAAYSNNEIKALLKEMLLKVKERGQVPNSMRVHFAYLKSLKQIMQEIESRVKTMAESVDSIAALKAKGKLAAEDVETLRAQMNVELKAIRTEMASELSKETLRAETKLLDFLGGCPDLEK